MARLSTAVNGAPRSIGRVVLPATTKPSRLAVIAYRALRFPAAPDTLLSRTPARGARDPRAVVSTLCHRRPLRTRQDMCSLAKRTRGMKEGILFLDPITGSCRTGSKPSQL